MNTYETSENSSKNLFKSSSLNYNGLIQKNLLDSKNESQIAYFAESQPLNERPTSLKNKFERYNPKLL